MKTRTPTKTRVTLSDKAALPPKFVGGYGPADSPTMVKDAQERMVAVCSSNRYAAQRSSVPLHLLVQKPPFRSPYNIGVFASFCGWSRWSQD